MDDEALWLEIVNERMGCKKGLGGERALVRPAYLSVMTVAVKLLTNTIQI